MKDLATVNMSPIQVAEVFVQSGMFPDAKQVATAASKLIVGRGLGLSDYDSMAGLHIIKGKVVLAANTMASAIKASGKYDYRAKTTEMECTITFYEVAGANKEEIGSTTFTIQDANNAGLRGDNWRKWPKAMLFARAISAGYREHCPDALGSAPVYVHEHGESEIPEEPKQKVTVQRETPELPKAEHANPKKRLVETVREWCGCGSDADCFDVARNILTFKKIPIDGSATETQIAQVCEWVDEQIRDKKTFSEVVIGDKDIAADFEVTEVQPVPDSNDSPEDPWGE